MMDRNKFYVGSQHAVIINFGRLFHQILENIYLYYYHLPKYSDPNVQANIAVIYLPQSHESNTQKCFHISVFCIFSTDLPFEKKNGKFSFCFHIGQSKKKKKTNFFENKTVHVKQMSP